MSTRFYFSVNESPDITPLFSSEWESTSGAFRKLMRKAKKGGLPYAIWPTFGGSAVVSTTDYLMAQFISNPLTAQTISGTVKGQIPMARILADLPHTKPCRALKIKVVSGDGGTVRGVLLDHFPSSLVSEFGEYSADHLSTTNRYFPPSDSLSSVDCQEGDRVVVEIGCRVFVTDTPANGSVIAMLTCDSDNTDLPEDEETSVGIDSYARLTDPGIAWIEFSSDLTFQAPAELEVQQTQIITEYSEADPQLQVQQTQFVTEFSEADPQLQVQVVYIVIEHDPTGEPNPEPNPEPEPELASNIQKYTNLLWNLLPKGKMWNRV